MVTTISGSNPTVDSRDINDVMPGAHQCLFAQALWGGKGGGSLLWGQTLLLHSQRLCVKPRPIRVKATNYQRYKVSQYYVTLRNVVKILVTILHQDGYASVISPTWATIYEDCELTNDLWCVYRKEYRTYGDATTLTTGEDLQSTCSPTKIPERHIHPH